MEKGRQASHTTRAEEEKGTNQKMGELVLLQWEAQVGIS